MDGRRRSWMRIQPALAPDTEVLVVVIEPGVPAERVATQDREADTALDEVHECLLLSHVVVLGMSRDDHEPGVRARGVPFRDIAIRDVRDRIPVALEPAQQRQVVAKDVAGAVALDVWAQ